MRHEVVLKGQNTSRHKPAFIAMQTVLCLLPVAVLVSSCGGDGSSSASSPILQVGMQRQYTGTATRTVVYADPSASQQNNTLEYTFTETQNVQSAPAGAAGDFDVHSEFAYTIVEDPGVGTVPLSQTADNYENLVSSAGTQMIVNLGQQAVVVSNDETADALGDGPYTATSTTTSAYTTPRDNVSYPLQTGATATVPQSETQTIVFTEVNASGSAPSNGSNVGYTQTRTENDDGSYSYQINYVNGNTSSRVLNADGSGSQTSVGATSTTETTVGLPVAENGVNVIPVAVTSGAAQTTVNYSAADWYPGSGMPSAPLVLATRSVIGPTSTLPSDCSAAVVRPGVYEIDTTTTSLNPLSAAYSTTMTRNFSASDGASVCQLSTETASSYDLRTGVLVSTTTTVTTTVLSMINY